MSPYPPPRQGKMGDGDEIMRLYMILNHSSLRSMRGGKVGELGTPIKVRVNRVAV